MNMRIVPCIGIYAVVGSKVNFIVIIPQLHAIHDAYQVHKTEKC